MPGGWIHRKVWLWWGPWWAVQWVHMWDEASLGIRFNWQRPLLDLYFGPLTIAFGKHVVYTDPRTAQWDSCRGMLFPDDQHHPLDARVL
jgi:hypothetical protein